MAGADKPPVSPLAPAGFPTMPAVAGVRMAVAKAGIKYKDRVDVLLAAFAPGTQVGGVLTRSLTASAPVECCRRSLGGGLADGLIVNSGNANAFSGIKGAKAVEQTVDAVADQLSSRPSRIFVASTGVIGEPLEAEKITNLLADMTDDLGSCDFEGAANAIMTTDTFAKGASATTEIGGVPVVISGIAKGSGMIAPDMATMLSFVFTDADIPHDTLQALIADGADRTFNAITVDSDTSTSDTLLAFATAQAGNPQPTGPDDPALAAFRQAFDAVLLDLAHQVVRDGEGASKFIAITVNGADSDGAAKRIGLAIANSPLVKTAIAGEDANWGRIVMAVGKAGEKADRDALSIEIGGVRIAEAGERVDGYDETPVAEHMQGDDIDIRVDVGVGSGAATVWTCDLTHGYISINADYRS